MPYVPSPADELYSFRPSPRAPLVAERDRVGHTVQNLVATRVVRVIEIGKDTANLVPDGLEDSVI